MDSSCGDKADEFFDAISSFPEGKPLFWSLIDYQRGKFRKIFSFFCEIETFYQANGFTDVRDELFARLQSRYQGKARAFPCHLSADIQRISEKLLLGFETLESENLTNVAFELFVTASLALRPNEYFQDGRKDWNRESDLPIQVHEPDGGMFFCWAEFAFLAAYFGFEPDKWRRILPVLLRAERIFPLCYGQPDDDGNIPSDRVFNDYNNISNDEFNFIHPDESNSIELLPLTRFDDLEIEATACARFAFPNEDWV